MKFFNIIWSGVLYLVITAITYRRDWQEIRARSKASRDTRQHHRKERVPELPHKLPRELEVRAAPEPVTAQVPRVRFAEPLTHSTKEREILDDEADFYFAKTYVSEILPKEEKLLELRRKKEVVNEIDEKDRWVPSFDTDDAMETVPQPEEPAIIWADDSPETVARERASLEAFFVKEEPVDMELERALLLKQERETLRIKQERGD